MNTILFEAIASVATVIAVLLISLGKTTGWIFSMIGSIFYSVLFFHNHLHGAAVLQIIYTIQAIFGLRAWIASDNTHGEFSCKKMPGIDFAQWIFLMTFIWIGNFLMDKYLFNINIDTIAYIDWSLMLCSLAALLLTSKRIIQSWYIWISVNIGYIALLSMTDMWMSVVLNFILIIISINGFLQWRKSLVTA
jgi:nicotinamide mononucleotide transporter